MSENITDFYTDIAAWFDKVNVYNGTSGKMYLISRGWSPDPEGFNTWTKGDKHLVTWEAVMREKKNERRQR